jgi:hypothetical protein
MDIDDRAERIGLHLVQHRRPGDPGVVDDHVEHTPTELGGGADGGSDAGGIGDIRP